MSTHVQTSVVCGWTTLFAAIDRSKVLRRMRQEVAVWVVAPLGHSAGVGQCFRERGMHQKALIDVTDFQVGRDCAAR